MTADIAAKPADAGTGRPNPYAGPRSLREGEPIYGRAREIRELRSTILARRIVLLYSQSGAGKSSLIEAGLRPELEKRKFCILPTVRVGYEPPSSAPGANRYRLSVLSSLEAGRAAEDQLDAEELASIGLDDYFARIAAEDPDRDPCLVFDQFEELFTLDPADWEEKEEFLEELGDALADRDRWALFSMREDFIAQLDPYVSLMPTRFANRYRLGLLGPAAAQEAAQEPAHEEGVDFTDEAAEQLVNDLRRIRVQRGTKSSDEIGPSVEPVQLQVVCRQLWSNLAPATTTIGPNDVITGGNVNEALASFYTTEVQSAASRTGASEREIREWFEEKLISTDGFRTQVRQGPGRSGSDVVRELEDAHLIRADRRRGTDWYELTHDRFVEPIRISNAEFRRQRRRRSTRWIIMGIGLAAIIAVVLAVVFAGSLASGGVEAEQLTADTYAEELDLGGNEVERFRFDAATGDEVEVRLESQGGDLQSADIRLLRDEAGQPGAEITRVVPEPAKQATAGDDRAAPTEVPPLILQHQLAMEGSYFIEVTSKGAAEFQFTYAKSQGSPIPTLESAKPQSGTLVSSSQVDLFAFDGEAGETVLIRLMPDAQLDGVVVLLDDAGTEVGFADVDVEGGAESITLALPVAGPYTIEVSGYEGSTGDYQLTLERPEVAPVTFDAPVSGTIASADDAQLYRLEATADEEVLITVAPSGALDSVLEIANPAGYAVPVDATVDGEPEVYATVIPFDGDYLITVSGYEGSTGDFALTVERPEVVGIAFDETVSGSIATPGHVDVHVFEAAEEQDYSISVSPVGGLDAVVAVVGPDGFLLPMVSEAEGGPVVVVDEAFVGGPHVVMVAGIAGSTGDYELTLTDPDR